MINCPKNPKSISQEFKLMCGPCKQIVESGRVVWFLDEGHALDSQSPHCESHRENRGKSRWEVAEDILNLWPETHFLKETVQIMSSGYFEWHPGRLVMMEQKAALMSWYFPLAKSQRATWKNYSEEMSENSPMKEYIFRHLAANLGLLRKSGEMQELSPLCVNSN